VLHRRLQAKLDPNLEVPREVGENLEVKREFQGVEMEHFVAWSLELWGNYFPWF